MCRVFGYLGSAVSPSRLERARDAQRSGGPDEQTWRTGAGWGLACNRLAIQDPANGQQPFTSADGTVTLVFNGEIYNFRELVAALAARGIRVPGDSDGSVLLPLYLEFGDGFVDLLEGMFAIAIVDLRNGMRMALHVDHLAVKSVYYTFTREGFMFSSETAGLVELMGTTPSLDPMAVDRYFEAQCMPGHHSFLAGVHRLEAGHTLVTDGFTARAWRRSATAVALSAEASPAALDDVLVREVDLMCRQETKVAVQVSGGLDSAILLTLLAQRRSDVTAFHVASEDRDHPLDERHYAVDAATHAGVRLEIVEIAWDRLPHFLPRVVRALGAPNATPHAVSAFALFEMMSSQGFRVCFVGDGADEQFGGYRRYSRALGDVSSSWDSNYLDRLSLVPELEYRQLYTRDYAALVDSLGSTRLDTLTRFRQPAPSRLERLLRFDRYVKLPSLNLQKLDHLSMAHGVEGRVPYCQPSITQFAEALPDSQKVDGDSRKLVLREAGRRYVPTSIAERTKQPFSLPVRAAMRPGTATWSYLRDTLSASSLVDQGVLDRAALASLMADHEGGHDRSSLLWGLLVLELAAAPLGSGGGQRA